MILKIWCSWILWISGYFSPEIVENLKWNFHDPSLVYWSSQWKVMPREVNAIALAENLQNTINFFRHTSYVSAGQLLCTTGYSLFTFHTFLPSGWNLWFWDCFSHHNFFTCEIVVREAPLRLALFYLGIAQMAIAPPTPRTQTGTLGHFFPGRFERLCQITVLRVYKCHKES